MHCNGLVHEFSDTAVWRQSLLVDALAYWAVPAFFMISGATLMRYRTRYSTGEFLKRRLLWYLFFTGFATCSVLPFVMSVLDIPYWGNFAMPLTGGYVLLPILGYLLSTMELSGRQRAGIYALGIVGAATRYGYTVYASVRDGALNKLTWEYMNWPSILFAAAMFVFIKYLCRTKLFRNPKLIWVVRWLSGASFGIYLIHIFVMGHLASLLGVNMASVWWRLLAAPVVYMLALTAVKLLQRIPVVGKYLFP